VLGWPFKSNDGYLYAIPTKIDFLRSVFIKTMSCGYNFAMFVTSTGQVYSFGSDNKEG